MAGPAPGVWHWAVWSDHRACERFDVRLDFADALVALSRVALERPEDDFIQAAVDRRMLRRRGEATQRQFTRQHFVEDDAERINVGPMIDFLRPQSLFRGH